MGDLLRPSRWTPARGAGGPADTKAMSPGSSSQPQRGYPCRAPWLPASPPLADDTFAFWRGLKDAGLLDEVVQEFHQELVETMKGLQQRVQDPPLQLRGEGSGLAPGLRPGPLPAPLGVGGLGRGALCSSQLWAEPSSVGRAGS